MGYRLGVDVGGTFTDLLLLETGTGAFWRHKTPSTPHDSSVGILNGVTAICTAAGIAPDAIAYFLHGTTVATNAVLEGKGAKVGLVTTEGYRHIMQIARSFVPGGLAGWIIWPKPQPLAALEHTVTVKGRIDAEGREVRPLDEDDVRTQLGLLKAAGVEAVTVSLINAYVNGAHEARIGAIAREIMPDAPVSLSHEVLPEMQEYERTLTTVANAAVRPIVGKYVANLRTRLAEAGMAGNLSLLRSDGGLMSAHKAETQPVNILMSGPAGGVTGAIWVGRNAGIRNIMTLDVGGTSTDVALIENLEPRRQRTTEVGHLSVRASALDVKTVGAGGGSIAYVPDLTGALRVGPQSAGAVPGPVAYAKGGTAPTVTDANVVLGYLNPDALAGGTVPIDAGLSRAAVGAIADRLERGVLETAYGIHRLANATMTRAVKAVSTYRGRDPRDFTLFAFGGNGGIHAAALAADLGMGRVIVPPGAGVFSAVGLLFTDHEVSHTAAWLRPLHEAGAEAITARFQALEAKVVAEMGADDGLELSWRADLRYQGQGFELSVAVPRGPVDEAVLAGIEAAFAAEHHRSYGHVLPDHRVDFVTLRVTGTRAPQGARAVSEVRRTPPAASAPTRIAYFGDSFGALPTPVIERAGLGPEPRPGPLIIEEYEGTTIVPPGTSAMLDAHGNIIITL